MSSAKWSLSRGTYSPSVAHRPSQTLLPAPGNSPFFLTRALPGTELWNFRFCALLFIESWWYWHPLLSSHHCFWGTDFLFSSCECFHSFSFSPATFGFFFLYSPDAPHSPPFLVLSPQKQLSTLCGFSLPQFTSPHRVPAEFCGSSYADSCVHP